MAEFSLVKNKLEAYKCSANEAVEFRLVRHETDLEDDQVAFPPEMTHQVFGEHETIFGYKDLTVQLYYTAGNLSPYIGVKYSDKITPDISDGVCPDDIMKKLTTWFTPSISTNLDQFVAELPNDASFKPFGEMIHSYNIITDGDQQQFEIYKTDISAPGFRDYHERLQTFIIFYIDAASYIDIDDDKWTFYLMFEKYKSNGNPMYATAGYMTVYNYYAYPEKIRPRISQMLVLPPFQRRSHGAQLLQTFYNDCYGRTEIRDITVEDPSENFQRLRDFIDAKNCMNLSSFCPDLLLEGFCDDMVNQAQKKLKLCKKQARHIYEILRLRVTNKSDPVLFKAYRLDIKRRLNIPFQKNGRDFQKLNQALSPDELSATLSCLTTEQRHGYLERTFQDHLDVYQRVIERLAAC